MQCEFTGVKYLDPYTCWAFDHPYYTIFILFFVGLTVGIIWFANTQMPKEEDGKKSTLTEFFEVLRDLFKMK